MSVTTEVPVVSLPVDGESGPDEPPQATRSAPLIMSATNIPSMPLAAPPAQPAKPRTQKVAINESLGVTRTSNGQVSLAREGTMFAK